MALLACALLLLAALVLVGGQLLENRRRDRQVAERLQGRMGGDAKFGTLLRQLGASSLAQRSVSLDNETQVLLNRIGWRKASQRSLFAAFQIGLPIVLLGLTFLGQQIFFPDMDPAWIAPLFGLGIGYLLPKRVLAAAADNEPGFYADDSRERQLDAVMNAVVRVSEGSGTLLAPAPEIPKRWAYPGGPPPAGRLALPPVRPRAPAPAAQMLRAPAPLPLLPQRARPLPPPRPARPEQPPSHLLPFTAGRQPPRRRAPPRRRQRRRRRVGAREHARGAAHVEVLGAALRHAPLAQAEGGAVADARAVVDREHGGAARREPLVGRVPATRGRCS